MWEDPKSGIKDLNTNHSARDGPKCAGKIPQDLLESIGKVFPQKTD